MALFILYRINRTYLIIPNKLCIQTCTETQRLVIKIVHSDAWFVSWFMRGSETV